MHIYDRSHVTVLRRTSTANNLPFMAAKVARLILVVAITSVSMGNAYAAASATSPPKKNYYLPNDNKPIRKSSLQEIVDELNSIQENNFSQCKNKPVYSCTRSVFTGSKENEWSPLINGERYSHTMLRYMLLESRNSAGNTSSHTYSSGGDFSAYVEWKCDAGYSLLAKAVSPGVQTVYCVISNLDPSKNKGPANDSCPAPTGGNPINFSVGNKYQEEVDLQVSSLSLSRAYNSLDGIWRHSFSMRLDFDPVRNMTFLTKETGQLSIFSGAATTPQATELGQLIASGGQWIYTDSENNKFTFNSDGLLTQQKFISGIERNITYSQNQLTVTDNRGSFLELTQDDNGQPLSFQLGSHQGNYTYSADNQLVEVDVATGGSLRTRQYHYEDARNTKLLTGITDERGVRYATWIYDAQGRAISSEHAGGAEKIQISYDSATATSVTSELGKVTKYTFINVGGVKRISTIFGEPSANCPNSNSSFAYNPRGQLTSKTDNKGYKTTYSYNTRGLESSRTEAAGTAQARTITTEWHPTFALPLVVTEPRRITRYEYDDQGRQLSFSVEAR